MNARVLKVHPADNVIVALRNLSAGERIEFENETYELPYAVGAKHKFVTEDRQPGEPITMYGVLVGKATQPIRRGEPITTFNLKHDADRYGLEKKQPFAWQAPDVAAWQDRTFMGYHRADGSVGTRNYWVIVPLVFCENRNVLILKDATSPYEFSWTGVPVGTYTITAKATDNQNATTTSSPVTVQVYSQGSPDPTADLIGPDCVFKNATQLFEVNASKLPNATSFSWWCTGSTSSITPAQPGKATINFGPSFTGGQVCVGINYSAAPWYSQFCKNVAVCPGTPPTNPTNQSPLVSLTSPALNAAFTAPVNVTLAASATDSDGNIAKVEFYNGSTKLGETSSSPYQFVWNNVSAGNYVLTAKATDNAGASATSSAITIQVNNPAPVNQAPTVTLTSPAQNATFTAPATVTLAANASDSDGTIAKVEFYNGSTKLGEDATSPYTFSWNNVAIGTYTLTAKAFDNSGASATSAGVTITVIAGTPPNNPGDDLIGPNCVGVNAVQIYEVNPAKLANATNFSWWCTGSTSSITPTQPGKATYSFGPWFTGGQVCVGINYSAAPWYSQYCKNVTVCGARTGLSEVSDNLVFPNPATDAFSFVADRDIQSMNVVDELGRNRLKLSAAKAGQTIRFGEQLPAGSYLFHIQYETKERRAIRLLKAGK